ncbi:ABC transporter ATP-binding protein [Rhizobium lentis]|uniref:ABC transporter ATP-binding protein n=2 Tax=Rhizobium lentis TaxID=1138194 RepID=A0ABS7I927_9HYPH|nr:ABC transporter ATP-binding protein [Rhizobium lentis]
MEVRGLRGWYGKSEILQGMDFTVNAGETVALLGRNGVGKTTTMRALTGLLARTEGDIFFEGQSILGCPTHVVARKGIALVPEHRGIFATLTVEENLRLAARQDSRWSVEDVLKLFPAIARRRSTPGGKLSGGEQQLLSIGRALVTGPKLLLLDEPTEGLAPIIVDQLVDLMKTVKQSGLSILLVEQSLEVCQKVADRLLILDHGVVAWSGTAGDLSHDPHARSTYLTLENP